MTAPTPTLPNLPELLKAKVVVDNDCRYGRMAYMSNDAYVGRSFQLYGEFSEGEVQIFKQILTPGDIVICAGANIGAHVVPIAQLVGPMGLVMAFEPFRWLANMLSANVALNGLFNVRTFNYALGAEPGEIMVPPVDFTLDDNYGGSALGNWEYGEKVPVITCDQFHLPRLKLIQADVEGMERDVLLGARALIHEHQPWLYLENDRGERSKALIELVREMGYTPYWHSPPLYNAENYRSNPDNVFGDVRSLNMVCLPEGQKLQNAEEAE